MSLALVLLTAFIYLTGDHDDVVPEAEREKEFFLFLALLVTGVFGVFASLDLFLFFLFYELAVFPMYVLIGIFGSSKEIAPQAARSAGRTSALRVGVKEYGAMKLTLYLLAGSAFILVGLFLMYVEGGKMLPQATFDFLQLQRRCSSTRRPPAGCSCCSTSASASWPVSGRSTPGPPTATPRPPPPAR